MTKALIEETVIEIEPLPVDEPIGSATRKVLAAGLPALPAVDADGKFAGIFGEREFMTALFPGYMNTLHSAAMVRRTIDETIERRLGCAEEPVSEYMTTDHVAVDDEHSDTQLAELFLHHRVLIIPIATNGKVHAVVTRCGLLPRTRLARDRLPRRLRRVAGLGRSRAQSASAASSAATRSPERIAPSMYPFQTVLVSDPAQWMRPSGSRSNEPY